MVSSTSSSGTNSLRRMVMRAPLISARHGPARMGMAGRGGARIGLARQG